MKNTIFIWKILLNGALFIGSSIIGILTAHFLSPSSSFAKFIGFAVFPAAFAVSFFLWQGVKFLLALLKRDFSSKKAEVRGSWIGFPVYLLLGLFAGASIFLIAGSIIGFFIIIAYFLEGLLFGLSFWFLGRSGLFRDLE